MTTKTNEITLSQKVTTTEEKNVTVTLPHFRKRNDGDEIVGIFANDKAVRITAYPIIKSVIVKVFDSVQEEWFDNRAGASQGFAQCTMSDFIKKETEAWEILQEARDTIEVSIDNEIEKAVEARNATADLQNEYNKLTGEDDLDMSQDPDKHDGTEYDPTTESMDGR